MSNKKSCENCLRNGTTCTHQEIPKAMVCDTWQRNPRKWLSILPTEPGWYWFKPRFKVVELMGEPEILLIDFGVTSDFLHVLRHGRLWKLVQDFDEGIWQGPITPKEDK